MKTLTNTHKRDAFTLRIGFIASFIIIPPVFGIFLAVIGPGYINLFWGSAYGLGWYVLGYFVEIRAAMLFGLLIWPILVTVALGYLGIRLWRFGRRVTPALLMFISMLLTFPIDVVMGSEFLSSFPLFYRMLFVSF
jgi:hypothetical protein